MSNSSPRHNRLRRFELDPPDAEAGEAPCPLHTVLLQSNLMGALPKLPRHRFPCLKTVQIDLVAAQRPDGGDDKGTGNGVGEAGDSGRGSSLLEEEYNGGGRASQVFMMSRDTLCVYTHVRSCQGQSQNSISLCFPYRDQRLHQ